MVFGAPLAFRNTAGEISNANKNLRSTGSAWNSGADTIETIPANTTGSISFAGNDEDHAGGGARNDFFVGLSRQSDSPATNFTGIRYAIYNNISQITIYESGTLRGNYGFFTDGDILEIHRNGGTGAITYRHNGTTVYTSGLTDTNQLKGDFCGFANNDRALNITMNRGNGPFNPFYSNKVNMIEY